MKKLKHPLKKKKSNNQTKKILLLIAILIGTGISASYVVQQTLIQKSQKVLAATCTATVSATDMKHIDDVVKAVMTKDAIPGLSVAITKDGRLVYVKGYGIADKSKQSPVTTSSRFRIASITKPFTSAGILKLVEQRRISLDQKVFGQGSILGNSFTSRPKDSRINNITVRQLLTHTSGMWTNDQNDPMGQNLSYSQSRLITSTLESRVLSTIPGSTYAYSNFGYLILGRVIERVTGQSYEGWMRNNIMAPAGIYGMQIAGNTLAERASNEVVYYGSGLYGNPYTFNIRRMDSHGGWIATPKDVARFMVRTDGFASPADLLTAANIQLATTPTSQSLSAFGNNIGYGMGWFVRADTHAWWHSGLVAGASSITVRRPEGFTWVVLNNADGASTVGDMDNMMYDATNGVTSWPQCDLF